MEIKSYTRDDIEILVDFMSRVFDDTYPGIFSDQFLKDFKDKRDMRIASENKLFDDNKNKDLFLLFDNDKLIGFVDVCKCHHEEYNTHGEVSMLYIDKEYQGKGLGKKLMSVGVNRLKEMGFNDFYVGCMHGNIESQKFYHHLGGEYKFSKPLVLDQIYQEDYFYFKDVNM